MHSDRQSSDTKPTASQLIRVTGLAAILAGIIFAGIQPIHPPDELASVATGLWAAIMPLKLVMCLLFLIGLTGLYARQVDRMGWVGLAGFLLFSLSWWLQTGFVFAEVFILAPLVNAAPQFIDSFLGIASGVPGEMDIGGLIPTYAVVGICYMLGGLLFGIASFRAGILPRWPAGLLAVTAILTPTAALLPHALQRMAAVPMGIALIWLGYALWSERRTHTSHSVPSPASA